MSISSHSVDQNSSAAVHSKPLTDSDYYIADYFAENDKVRDRSCTIIHRGSNRHETGVSVDSGSIELHTYKRVVPLVFIYDQDSVDEKYYESIENIPYTNNNQCIWIDVNGVSLLFQFDTKVFRLL